MKPETNNRRKSGKFMNTWKLNSTLQTTPITNRSKKKFKNKKERTTKAKTGICIDTDLDVQIRLAFKRWNGLEVDARQKDTSFEDRQS